MATTRTSRRRPGFPHRVTLDLTADQFKQLSDAVDEAGGSMADYMRAMIELYKQDPSLADKTVMHLRQMRARQRAERRQRGNRPPSTDLPAVA